MRVIKHRGLRARLAKLGRRVKMGGRGDRARNILIRCSAKCNPGHKLIISRFTGKVPMSAQQQMLLQPPLQMPVVRLDIAVLIGTIHMDRPGRQSVMRHNDGTSGLNSRLPRR